MAKTRRFRAAAAALAMGALAPGALLAHAHLVGAAPADGETVDAAPEIITLAFDDALELEFSSFTLRPADGEAQDLSAVAGAGAQSVELAVPETLPPGAYALDWAVMASDGHVTEGTLTFTVAGD